MGLDENIRTGRHCVFRMHVHLVFGTKYRHSVFAHLLVNFPPKIAVSRLVNSLKDVSSRRLRQEFPDLVRHYWRAQRL